MATALQIETVEVLLAMLGTTERVEISEYVGVEIPNNFPKEACGVRAMTAPEAELFIAWLKKELVTR